MFISALYPSLGSFYNSVDTRFPLQMSQEEKTSLSLSTFWHTIHPSLDMLYFIFSISDTFFALMIFLPVR